VRERESERARERERERGREGESERGREWREGERERRRDGEREKESNIGGHVRKKGVMLELQQKKNYSGSKIDHVTHTHTPLMS